MKRAAFALSLSLFLLLPEASLAMPALTAESEADSSSTSIANRCERELGQLHDFALRETDRLTRLLENVKSEIEYLPAREKVRAKIRWVEADSARLDLKKALVSAMIETKESNEPCAMTAETIRADLFRTQELGFNLSLDYDARLKPQPLVKTSSR